MNSVEVLIDGREYVSKDWHGLHAILSDVYPADIFTGSSGDPGPTIVALARRVAETLLLLDQYEEFDRDPQNVYGRALAAQRIKVLRNVLTGSHNHDSAAVPS